MALTLSGTDGITFNNSTVQASAGQVLQVVSVTKSDTFTTTSLSFVDITGLTATITPKFSTSKILVQVVLGSTAATNVGVTLLLRDSTTIAAGDGANGVLGQIYSGGSSEGEHYYGNIPTCATYLDSPATASATTYKVQMKAVSTTAYLNRSFHDSSPYGGRTISTITLMEIAG